MMDSRVAVSLYLLAVGLAIALAYKLVNVRWQRRERARIAVGVLCVVVPAITLALFGLLDMYTTLVILAGFGVAGGVTLLLDIETETEASATLREAFNAQSD